MTVNVTKYPLRDLEVGEAAEFPVDREMYLRKRAVMLRRRSGLTYRVNRVDGVIRVTRTA